MDERTWAAFYDEVAKIAEVSDAPTPLEALRYGVAGPLLRVGLPVAAGVGLGYMGGGTAAHILQKSPAAREWWVGLGQKRQLELLAAAAGLGGAASALGTLGLGFYRHRAYDELEQERLQARQQQ